MKLITSKGSSEGLKVLFAAQLTGIEVTVDLDPNVKRSVLVVNERVRLFSANAAVWYLLASKSQSKTSRDLDSWLDWEATNLSPLIEKKPSDLSAALTHLENKLKGKFISGVSLFHGYIICIVYNFMFLQSSISAADIVISASLFTIDKGGSSFSNNTNTSNWYKSIIAMKEFKVISTWKTGELNPVTGNYTVRLSQFPVTQYHHLIQITFAGTQ